MPYTTSQRVRIHYEVEGDGPPLVLHHGLAGSAQIWRDLSYTTALASGEWRDFGYTDVLQPGFKLILIDARGHGKSDKPYQSEAYRVESLASDVLVVLDALRIPRAFFWGYSIGAAVGYALAAQARDRFGAFVLGSYAPYGVRTEAERKFCDASSQAMAVAVGQGMAAYADAVENPLSPFPAVFRSRLNENDARALSVMTKTCYRWPGIGQVVNTIAAPCLLYAGEKDAWFASVKEAAGHLPRAEFIPLSGHDHFAAFYASHTVLPSVQRFLLAASQEL